MARILAVGSPKGGVMKTTLAVTLALIAARLMGLRVLLVDADQNGSAISWARSASDEAMPLEVAPGTNVAELAQLRRSPHDLVVADLPGAKAGEWEAILRGRGGRSVADLLLMPSPPDLMDIEVVMAVIHKEVKHVGIPYLLTLTRVTTQRLSFARQRQENLRAAYQAHVAETVIREYQAYRYARENLIMPRNRDADARPIPLEQLRRLSGTVLDLPGRHSHARTAEAECIALAVEAFGQLELDTRALEVA